jgi:site-specific DNA recombinase
MTPKTEIENQDLQFVVQERAVLYARVSNDDRKNATSSIESQLSDGRKYCKEKNYNIVAEFFEEPNKQTSGADWLPGIEEVLRLAKKQIFDVFICREIDRLARNRFKQLSIENTLSDYGVRVEYFKGQYENTPEGNLLKGMMGEFAEYERNKTRERTMRGKIRSVEAGNVTIGGSRPPYGYDLVKKNGRRVLVINEQEAAIVVLIFDMYVNQHFTLYTIADYLDRHYIPKPGRGVKRKKVATVWSPSTVRDILSNEVYVGRWYYRKYERVKNPKTGKRSRDIMRPKSEWLMVEVPAIVNEEFFEAAQNRRETNKREKGKTKKHPYLLSGMGRCGHCGHGVTGATKTDKTGQWSYYICCARHHPKRYAYRCDDSTSFRRDIVEDVVWKWVKSILLDEDYLDQCLERYEQEYEDSKRPVLDMIKANRARLISLEQEKDRLIKGYRTGILALDEIAEQKTDIDRQITNIKKAITEIEGDLGPERLTSEDKDKIKGIAAKIRKGANLADERWDIKRELFETLHVQVSFIYQEGKRWADVSCVLDDAHLPTEYTTRSCRVNCRTLQTRDEDCIPTDDTASSCRVNCWTPQTRDEDCIPTDNTTQSCRVIRWTLQTRLLIEYIG